MKTRIGMTLLEVLISIFIMGIGMLSVLAMFPAAADMMGRAISNAQMAEGLVNARGLQDGVDWTSSAYSITIGSPNTPGWNNPPTPPNVEVPTFLLLDQFAVGSLVPLKFNNLQIEVGSIRSGDPGIAGRFFTSNSDLILNKSGVANLGDDGAPVLVEREAKFTIAHFFTKPMPTTSPKYIKRNILVFKDRSQVITANDFTYYPISPMISPIISTNQLTLSVNAVNANVVLKTRQWVMVTDSIGTAYPTAVDFFEISTVDDSGATRGIEISPSLPLGFGTGAKSVYLLKDVAKVIYSGY